MAARSKSTIAVQITGDSSSLQGAVKGAQLSLGTLAKIATTSFIGIRGFDFLNDFIQGGLEKFDTFRDSFERFGAIVGSINEEKLKATAFDLTNIGLSADEVGSLAANFAAFASTAGVTSGLISNLTPDFLNLAAAIAQTTDKPLDEVINDIGRAINGNQKSVADYGITIDKNATAASRLWSILAQLRDRFPEVTTAINDQAGAQDILTAKWDNFGIRVGQNLEGPIHDLQLGLIFMADEILPDLGKGFDTLGDRIGVWGRDALSPINLVADALGGLGDLINNVANSLHSQFDARTVSESQVVRDLARFDERNGQGRP